MTEKVYVFGGGGTARDVLAYFKRAGVDAVVVVPVSEKSKAKKSFSSVIVEDEFFEELERSDKTMDVVVAVSQPVVKKKIVEKLLRWGERVRFENIFMSEMYFQGEYEIGRGCVVFPNVGASDGVKIGNWVTINTGTWIPHDVFIGDYVTIEINVSISGLVFLDEGAIVGSGAVILPGVRVGKYAVVGAGAVVVKDVPDGATVFGNPARVVFKKKV